MSNSKRSANRSSSGQCRLCKQKKQRIPDGPYKCLDCLDQLSRLLDDRGTPLDPNGHFTLDDRGRAENIANLAGIDTDIPYPAWRSKLRTFINKTAIPNVRQYQLYLHNRPHNSSPSSIHEQPVSPRQPTSFQPSPEVDMTNSTSPDNAPNSHTDTTFDTDIIIDSEGPECDQPPSEDEVVYEPLDPYMEGDALGGHHEEIPTHEEIYQSIMEAVCLVNVGPWRIYVVRDHHSQFDK